MGNSIYLSEKEKERLLILLDNLVGSADFSEEDELLYKKIMEKLKK
jgi:hypothetical protein